MLLNHSNDATSDSELQFSDAEDDARSDSLEMGDFIEHSCRMRYSTKQVKDSGIFPGGWGRGVRHNLLGIWKGVRANLPLLRGGVLCKVSPCEAHFSPPPPPPDNYCTVP